MSGICYNCFREKSSYGPCSFCSYDPTGAEKKYPLALKPGTILNGRYIVGRALGQGGFGITYIAQDYQTGERVAIKEYFPSEFAGRSGSTLSSVQVHSENQKENFDYGKSQFLEEARTLAAFIGDEHIVRIYSYFEENNTAYFVMEYVDGYALDKYMVQKGGRLGADEARKLFLPLMQSLGAVHAKGIIHRDIAPDNILITKAGMAKLIDFGAARYSTGEKSRSLDVILKHGFAPAEQYMRRGRQGPYTDVYALAATWYYALTGKVLPDAVERMQNDTLLLPRTLGVKLSIQEEDVLLKALEVNAQDRYQNMTEFYQAMADASGAGSAVPAHGNRRDQSAPSAEPFSPTGFTVPQAGLSPREEAALLEKRAKEILAEEERKEREEKERLARIEAARLEQERREREAREEAARLERERKAKEAREAEERRKREAKEAEERRKQEARAEAERLKKERAEQKAREEAARQEKLRLEREKREEEKRLAAEKKKKEAEEKERLRQETLAKQKVEQEQKRAEAEQLKKEREEQKAQKAKEKALQKQKAKETPTVDSYTSDVVTTGKAKQKKKTPLFAAIAAILLVAVAVGFYVSPGQAVKRSYNKGLQLVEAGQYSEAIAQFESAPNYKDSQEQIRAAYYAEGLALKEDEDWGNAVSAFAKSGDYKDAQAQIQEIENELLYREATVLITEGQNSKALNLFESLSSVGYKDSKEKIDEIKVQLIADSRVGDIVYFGAYEQDNDLTNGKEDIEWLVLAREDDRILVISKFALDYQPYDDYAESKRPTWETCSLRKWLNTDFLAEAFSGVEQNCIPEVTVTADKFLRGRGRTLTEQQGRDTQDKIYLLSCEEAESYFTNFTNNQKWQCSPSAYAAAKGNDKRTADSSGYWLRTVLHDGSQNYVYIVIPGGIVINYSTGRGSVRPAMWINTRDVQAAPYYAEGLAQREAENWGAAIQAFEKAGDYSDAKEQAAELRLHVEMQNMSTSQVGDYVFFGSYEQDNNQDNGKEPIEWLVLDVQDGKSLLISKYALDFQPFNKKAGDTTWETCSLRTWLNRDFLSAAFSDEEINRIPTTFVTVDYDYISDKQHKSTKTVEDKVFLLSWEEGMSYFASDALRHCEPTASAQATEGVERRSYNSWWLRSVCDVWGRTAGDTMWHHIIPYHYYDDAPYSYGTGLRRYQTHFGKEYALNLIGVRPAIWVIWES